MSNAAEPEFGLLALVRSLLQEHGPMTAAALAAEFDEDVDVVTDDLYDITDGSIAPLLDDRWVDVPSLLAGRVFTHRLAAAEVAHDGLAASPDLELILAADEAGERLSSGAPIDLVFPGMVQSGEREIPDEVRDHGGTIALPLGTLAGLGAVAGDLVGLHVTKAGLNVLRVELDELADPQPVLDALAVVVEHDRPSYIGRALMTVCADAPDAFRKPVLPIRDLIAIAGLAHDADYLAPPGFDLAGHQEETRRNALARRYDLSRPEAHATMVLLQHLGGRIHRSPEEVAAASAFLAEPAVAEAVRRSTLFGHSGPDELTDLVDDLWPQRAGEFGPSCSGCGPRRTKGAARFSRPRRRYGRPSGSTQGGR